MTNLKVYEDAVLCASKIRDDAYQQYLKNCKKALQIEVDCLDKLGIKNTPIGVCVYIRHDKFPGRHFSSEREVAVALDQLEADNGL